MIDLKNIGKTQVDFLRDAYNHDKIAHSYLFIDPMQEKGLATAYWLACLFNCTGTNKPDGTCNECQRILSGNHPDVFLVKLEGKQTLSIDQVRPLKEELSKSPVEGTRRFFFIENADKLTLAANNALLNLLEEPVAPVVTILIANNANQILPTVRSRTQIVNFYDEKEDSRYSKLLEFGLNSDEIADLGDTSNLEQECKYLYQELLENSDMAIVRVHKLAGLANKPGSQKFVFYQLKQFALDKIDKYINLEKNAQLLQLLMDCDKMRASNVNFHNCLDYLVLKFE
ncbi:DNA polymerase-3 subunit delta' [Lactobacillus colini]|uniref:DNA polymerase-3 subunit delta n=1 Tax=Lactobacillus colini TaxID=1819254 RepID=A0ABS4MGU5_9LACO|nr:DNA polymerase III subunit [Lactobacillus colini]MBP2058531.1 DNA polymerase-3 subunit delta' [Lactobacillus colini]